MQRGLDLSFNLERIVLATPRSYAVSRGYRLHAFLSVMTIPIVLLESLKRATLGRKILTYRFSRYSFRPNSFAALGD